MPRLFQTRQKGERPVFPPKVVEVFNPLFVVEESLSDGNWIPTTTVFTDSEDAKKHELAEGTRLALYQRVKENG